MNASEREGLEAKKRDLEATLGACLKNIADAESKAQAFKDKRNRVKAELAKINKRLTEKA